LTDCPHREKLGWSEEVHLLAGCLMFNYDVPLFFAKTCDDLADSQTAEGLIPGITPEYVVFEGGFRDSPGCACVGSPWHVYQQYGDASLMAKHYETMKKYVDYLGTKSKARILWHGLGDWADYGPNPPGESQLTSKELVATAMYYENLVLLQRAARLLGKSTDAEHYGQRAGEVAAALNKRLFHADTNRYDRNSQTANAMPLALGLVSEDRRAAVLQNLVDVTRASGNRITTGSWGGLYLVRALTDCNRGDVLYDIVCQDKGPGYMYQLKMGATTLTETWDCWRDWSQNHCMLGHVEVWFYRGLGGIRPDPAGPGFKRFTVAPQAVGDLTSVATSYRSMYGQIISRWKRDGRRLTLNVTVPVNTTAVVRVPAKDAAAVTEGGRPAGQAEGVRFLRRENRAALYEVGAGSYCFSSEM
jgi:alpha-L-rhamnosidase